MSDNLLLGPDRLTPGSAPAIVIAEVAQAHDGSLGTAHAFIDAIAHARADAVKFQTHIASAESTPAEPWRVTFSKQDATRYDYWRRMEFTEEQWVGLRNHARDRGLMFISSAFSTEAVDLLSRIGVSAWKVASGEVASCEMLDAMLRTGLPVILSTGMSGMDEIDKATQRIIDANVAFALLQCTTKYPSPPEEIGLNVLEVFRSRYNCGVGLSDHSGTIYPGLAAAALRAQVIEVHVTLSREMFGPDVQASITTSELRSLTDGVRYIGKMLDSPVNKDERATELAGMRRLFMKSVVSRVALPAGTVLTKENLAAKKPGTGIPANEMPGLLGRRLRISVDADTVLTRDMFEAD